MATYYGFNTIDQEKKFSLTNFDLVKRDLLNSLLIKPGEKLGNPQYGSKINTILFETQDAESFLAIEKELSRVIRQDPRIVLDDIQIYTKNNGILVELFIKVLPATEQQRLSLFFDRTTQTAQFA